MFREEMAGWIQALGTADDAALERYQERLWRAASCADSEESLEGLDELWVVMRHVSRPDCWRLLPPQVRDRDDLRPDIREFLAPNPAAEDDWSAFRAAAKEFLANQAAAAERSRNFAARACEVTDGDLERHLPTVRSYGRAPYPHLFDPDDAMGRFRRGYELLCQLTRHFEPRLGEDPRFWGVLGPVEDALGFAAATGFEEKITLGRTQVLLRRMARRRADLLDCWLLLRSGPEERSEETEERFLDRARETPTAALEDFFDALWIVDVDDEPESPPEAALPMAGVLWREIVEREDVSLALLARAGLYFSARPRFRRGPALPLVAHALRSLEQGEDLGEVPCLLLAAFEDAARRRQRTLALACLNRCLLFLGTSAAGLRSSQLGQIRVTPDHIYATVTRSWRRRNGSPQFPLWFALARVRENPGLRSVGIVRVLERVGRVLNVGATGVVVTLREKLGQELWEKLHEDTREMLRVAEVYWCALESGSLAVRDYSAVGVSYRRAIEHEWRVRIGPRPWIDGAQTLGVLVRDLLELRTVGRRELERQFGSESVLLRGEFLRRTLRLCGRYLNPAAHREGLTRERCRNLRGELLQRGFLKEVLGAVHREDSEALERG